MKILIILAILAVAYLVYRAATADPEVIVQPVKVEQTDSLPVEPEVKSKKFLFAAIAITIGIVAVVAAAFLL